jgi:hypothetical protein
LFFAFDAKCVLALKGSHKRSLAHREFFLIALGSVPEGVKAPRIRAGGAIGAGGMRRNHVDARVREEAG